MKKKKIISSTKKTMRVEIAVVKARRAVDVSQEIRRPVWASMVLTSETTLTLSCSRKTLIENTLGR